MNSGYKHFSHEHNLILHQTDEAAKMSCSGCKSLVIGTIYVCWQCKFVLHEQCFRATRSLIHPSHSSHPLTLVPYPTYPSNFFYCNICKLMGTGFSYSCSHCEVDIHVHCAHHSYIEQSVFLPSSAQHSKLHVDQHGGNIVSAQTTNHHNPTTNPKYSSMAPTSEYGSSSELDLELLKMDMQRLKIEKDIEKEEIMLAAKSRKEFYEFLYQL